MDVLTDTAAAALAPDAEYRIREIVQDGIKFMKHSKRKRLTTTDINAALRLRNIPRVYGVGNGRASDTSNAPVRGYREVDGMPELFFLEEREINVKDLLKAELPPVPLDATVSAHWLAIDGNQPLIPQNPSRNGASVEEASRIPKRRRVEADIKPILRHDLSRELKLYYEEVTKSIFDSNEEYRETCINSVATDPGIGEVLPYLSRFLFETVKAHTHRLPVLFSCLRLTNAILDNPGLNVELYLQQMLPAVVTCIVGRRLFSNPRENHWGLREYGVKLMVKILNRFRERYSKMQPNFTKTLTMGLDKPKNPLTTHYGCIVGLTALGERVVDSVLLTRLPKYVKRLADILGDRSTKQIRRQEALRVLAAIASAASKAYLRRQGWFDMPPRTKGVGESSAPREVVIEAASFGSSLSEVREVYDRYKGELKNEFYPCTDVTDEATLLKAMVTKHDPPK